MESWEVERLRAIEAKKSGAEQQLINLMFLIPPGTDGQWSRLVLDLCAVCIELLTDLRASDVWAEGRGSRNADVLWVRMCRLLDGEKP